MQLQRYNPELEVRKAHDVRKLEPCKCGGLGMRPQMIKVQGEWWHGRCAIAHFGIERIAALPKQVYGGLRLSEIGSEAMKRLLNTN